MSSWDVWSKFILSAVERIEKAIVAANTKIDNVLDKSLERTDALEDKFDSKYTDLDKKIDNVKEKIDKIKEKEIENRIKLANVDSRLKVYIAIAIFIISTIVSVVVKNYF